MEWNPASLTPAPHQHLPGSLTIPHVVQQSTTATISPLASSFSAASRVGGVVLSAGLEQNDDAADDRKPNTPRNSSPAILASDFGEESLPEENHDDILVFGYGCKIFRDAERAQWIEDQKHLIPWMGNADLLIDRYDCRGALMDITKYESGSRRDNTQDSSENDSDLDSSFEQEQLLEKELDEERYKELNEDVDYDEGAFDRAGDYKRLQTAMNGMLAETQAKINDETRNYAAFQYNYEEQNHDISIGPEPKRVHDEDAPYVRPVGLYIPEEIILPATMKIHAIIEKTAKFIASQGNQMEIILKTKQSSNPLFDFLNHGGNLNAYYKFLVHAIRSGIYRPPTEQDDVSSSHGHSLSSEYSGSEEDSEQHTYLHPSLFRTSNTSSQSALSSIDYTNAAIGSAASTSSKHNAYSMLVSKIKGTESPDPACQQSSASTTYSPEYPTPPLHQNSNSQNMYSLYGYKLPSQQAFAVSPTIKPHKKLPSTSDQLIIEKMASYVIKNGANFEVLAKNKSDPRFGFLNPAHEFHWYYLNCKERFKAECTAVVASSEFVNYTNSSSSNSNNNVTLNSGQNSSSCKANTTTATAASSTIKKSAVAAELAELKRKSIALLGKKEPTGKDKGVTAGGGGAENVFPQASLVQSKEKDKPVIRFSSSLKLNSVSAPPSTSAADEVKREEGTNAIELPSPTLETTTTPEKELSSQAVMHNRGLEPTTPVVPILTPVGAEDGIEDEEEEGEIRDDDEGDSDSDLYLLDDDPGTAGGGNSTPASEDDEEKVRRRLERKRKAALFLQKLKMSKSSDSCGSNSVLKVSTTSKEPSVQTQVIGNVPQKSTPPGSSLGDLLNLRLQNSVDGTAVASQKERIINAHVPPEIIISDSEDNGHGGTRIVGRGNNSKSSSSSRHSSRSRSRNHATSSSRTSRKRRKRRRSRSYSSSHSPSRSSSSRSSYESSSRTAYSKKKSSKKKRKKKKKKYDKSSRSSHKSKRR